MTTVHVLHSRPETTRVRPFVKTPKFHRLHGLRRRYNKCSLAEAANFAIVPRKRKQVRPHLWPGRAQNENRVPCSLRADTKG